MFKNIVGCFFICSKNQLSDKRLITYQHNLVCTVQRVFSMLLASASQRCVSSVLFWAGGAGMLN